MPRKFCPHTTPLFKRLSAVTICQLAADNIQGESGIFMLSEGKGDVQMFSGKPFFSGIPPKLPGSYIIRDADGDIICWGDTANLYETWRSKTELVSTEECWLFTYVLNDM